MKLILIASRPRSGTHWLKSALGSCPHVAAHMEEPFHETWSGQVGFWDGKTEPTQHLLSIAEPGTEAVVFCAHPNHYEWSPDILPSLLASVTHVVILYRRDLLAGFVSMELAERNWEWPTAIGSPPSHGTIDVDLAKFREWCELVKSSLATDKQRWSDRPCSVLCYEDLAGHYESVMRDVGESLGIETSNAVAATEKKERRLLWEVVTNYHDARAAAAECAIP